MRVHITVVLLICTVCILADLDVRRLVELGKILENMLKCKNKYKGKLFFERLETYKDYMDEVLKNVDEFTITGKQYYKALEKQNGPPHLRSKLDKSCISVMMNMTLEKVEEVESIINKTAQQWRQIQSIYANRSHEEDTVAILVDDFKIVEA